MRKSFLLVLFAMLLGAVAPVALNAQEKKSPFKKLRPDSVYAELEHYIGSKAEIFRNKEERIALLRGKLRNDSLPYHNTLRLFNEYKSYLYDSAYAYANRLLEIAQAEDDPSHIVEAKGNVMFCLISAGLFKEASDVANSIRLDGVDRDGRITFYRQMSNLNFSLSNYNQHTQFTNDYIRRGCLYCDSVIALLPQGSKEAVYMRAVRQMHAREYGESMQLFERYVHMSSNIHEHAIAYSCLNILYNLTGDSEEAFRYVIKAAINDIRGGVTETTALRSLAEILYNEGDVERANRYIGLALEDAMFYDARHRKLEIGSVMPTIEEKMRNLQLEEMGHRLQLYFYIIVALGVLLCAAVVAIAYLLRTSSRRAKP